MKRGILVVLLNLPLPLAAAECFLNIFSNETDDPITVTFNENILIKPHMMHGFRQPLRYGLGCSIKNTKKKQSLYLHCNHSSAHLEISAIDPTRMEESDSFLDLDAPFFTHKKAIDPTKSYIINVAIKDSDMRHITCDIQESN